MDFDKLYEILPLEIKNKLDENEFLVENPKFHPEKNAKEHIKIVVNRLSKLNNIDLVLAGLFHDICKKESAIPRENSPYFLCKDHEKKGADFAMKHHEFISSLGADFYKVHFICWNHMKMKVWDEMRKNKKENLMKSEYFNDLYIFSLADKMFFDWDNYIYSLKEF